MTHLGSLIVSLTPEAHLTEKKGGEAKGRAGFLVSNTYDLFFFKGKGSL